MHRPLTHLATISLDANRRRLLGTALCGSFLVVASLSGCTPGRGHSPERLRRQRWKWGRGQPGKRWNRRNRWNRSKEARPAPEGQPERGETMLRGGRPAPAAPGERSGRAGRRGRAARPARTGLAPGERPARAARPARAGRHGGSERRSDRIGGNHGNRRHRWNGRELSQRWGVRRDRTMRHLSDGQYPLRGGP